MTPASGEDVRTRLFVISLDDAHERRTYFEQIADREAVELDWSFFDAHRCVGDHLVYDAALPRSVHGRDLSAGELGCYSSHSALWAQLLDDPATDQYIIVEDDVLIDWAALRTVADHDFARAGHAYVRLFARKPSPFLMLHSDYLAGPRALLALTGKPFGTQAYIVTREGAKAMLAACNIVVRPIDDQMDRCWEWGMPNLALFPFPVIERFAPSTIGAARFGNGYRGRSRFKRWRDRASRWIAVTRYRLSRPGKIG